MNLYVICLPSHNLHCKTHWGFLFFTDFLKSSIISGGFIEFVWKILCFFNIFLFLCCFILTKVWFYAKMMIN